MRVVFVHQNCPGQFKHLAPRLAADPRNRVVFFGKPGRPNLPGVDKREYRLKREAARTTHHYVRTLENGVLHGQAVARLAVDLRSEGFRPDLIVAHVAWGEALYLKDVWPGTPLLGYFEFYYHAQGSDVGFLERQPPALEDACRVRTRNALHLLSLELADWGVSPTRWQWSQFPTEFRDRISVIHDGIDTHAVVPDAGAVLELPSGEVLRRGDEVVTYVARNLEPYRGFPTFLKAAERILRRRPKCRIVVVGGDEVSYGAAAPDGKTWREHLLSQVDMDRSRIHFLGWVPYARYLKVLQVSAVHIYLTVPFVLSWSMLEAMAAGCLVVGSRTPPVEEVLIDGQNGLLADFFSPDEVADQVVRVLDAPDGSDAIRRRARETVLASYALDRCLPRQLGLLEDLAAGRRPRVGTPPPAPVQGRPRPVSVASKRPVRR